MKVGKRYSHLNGYEWLQCKKPELWDETKDVITKIDAEKYRTKVANRERQVRQETILA